MRGKDGVAGSKSIEYGTAVPVYTGAQINFGHLTPYLTYVQILLIKNWNFLYFWILKKIVLLYRICNADPQPTKRWHPCERAGHEQEQQGRNECYLWSLLGLVYTQSRDLTSHLCSAPHVLSNEYAEFRLFWRILWIFFFANNFISQKF